MKRLPREAEATGLENGTGMAVPAPDDEVAVLIRERLKSFRNRAGLSLERSKRFHRGTTRGH